MSVRESGARQDAGERLSYLLEGVGRRPGATSASDLHGLTTPPASVSQTRSRWLVRVSVAALAVLIVASWTFVLGEQEGGLRTLLSRRTLDDAALFLRDLVGWGTPDPAYLDPAAWANALRLTYETLLMSVLAIGIAGILTLLTVIPAARTAADGSLTLTSSWWSWALYGLWRGAYIASRAIPELIWAMLIVFLFTPGILPGALALGIHNFGILGKLCAEVVEDLDLRPVRAVRAAGASSFQTLFYAVLPGVLPQFMTYLLYRWEVIIRTTIVVGFVSAGGLGRQFRLSMSWFHFTDVALLLVCYVVLVFLVDLASAALRRLAR